LLLYPQDVACYDIQTKTFEGHPRSKVMISIDSPGYFHIQFLLTPSWWLLPFWRCLTLKYKLII